MNLKNYYKILGVQKNASKTSIKTAYRKLVLFWHPDKNSSPKAHEMIVKINEAYEILFDDEKRKTYDILYDEFFKESPTSLVVYPFENTEKQNPNHATSSSKDSTSKTNTTSPKYYKYEDEFIQLDEWINQAKERATILIKNGLKAIDTTLENVFSIIDYLFWAVIAIIILIVLATSH